MKAVETETTEKDQVSAQKRWLHFPTAWNDFLQELNYLHGCCDNASLTHKQPQKKKVLEAKKYFSH